MVEEVAQHRHQQVGHTEADWLGAQGDPVLPARIIGWVLDTGEHVVFDGSTPFSGLTRYGGDVAAAVSALVDAAPETLDTLNELAEALGDDPNFATTVNNAIAARLTETEANALYRRLDALININQLTSPGGSDGDLLTVQAGGGVVPLAPVLSVVDTAGGTQKFYIGPDEPADPDTDDLWFDSDASAPSGASIAGELIIKSADETVNNSDAMQADDELSVAIAAGETVAITFVVFYESSTTADFKVRIVSPAGATQTESIVALQAGVTNDSGSVRMRAIEGGAQLAVAGSGLVAVAYVEAVVVNDATAGTVDLQWAQSTAEASNTVVHDRSYAHVRRVA